ncbi:hypothetical protein B0T18DRAFT_413480 [Schizothecium vesticola]|uniref:DUF6594 domain-containing protein n=1 Tax=Schizothecium vesticola TaxID=314040 RepID=A0AA40ENN8_9PEZI|nr:hypothetical protein B0T18DRAFT_413480 [Schizothecium vesticola]
MLCHHCPGLKFHSNAERDAHLLGHDEKQWLLHRGGRTYGAKLGVSHTSSSPVATRASLADSVLPVHQSTSAEIAEPDQALPQFMDQDPAYMITRRFSRLNTLNLLWMQDELTDLEEQYHQARVRSSLANPEMAANGTSALRMQIRNKLREYEDALIRCARLCELNEPDHRSVADMRRWVADSSISGSSVSRFLQEMFEADLRAISPNQADKTWLYRMVEDISYGIFAKTMFGGHASSLPGDGTIHIYKDSWVHATVRALSTFLSALILSVPLGGLSKVDDRSVSVTVVAVCSTVLAMLLAVGTRCRDHEIIVAVSAYAAVLIVFAAN